MINPPRRAVGFTIIELLVVVAITAVLITLLLPALGMARRDAQLVQSLSNLNQIGKANTAYSIENEGILPIRGVYRDHGQGPRFQGMATWSFGGKFASSYWANHSGGLFDLAPSARPLNDYVYPGKMHPRVTGIHGFEGPARPANESERINHELEVFRSPRDIASVQRPTFGDPVKDVSAYDDTGTSYFYNSRWYFQFRNGFKLSGAESFARTHEIWQGQTGFDPSRFVLYHDQLTELIRGDFYAGVQDVFSSDYGKDNHSAMVFFDGHAAFEEVLTGQESGENYDLAFDLEPN